MTSIFNNGVRTCVKDRPRRTSLMYKCHNKKYLGAAQGLSGVLHCLLLVCFNLMNIYVFHMILIESFQVIVIFIEFVLFSCYNYCLYVIGKNLCYKKRTRRSH